MDFQQLADLIGKGGWVAVPSILVFILFTNLRGDWRPRREFTELTGDRNEWKAIAIKATETAREQGGQIEKLTDIVERLTDHVSRGTLK